MGTSIRGHLITEDKSSSRLSHSVWLIVAQILVCPRESVFVYYVKHFVCVCVCKFLHCSTCTVSSGLCMGVIWLITPGVQNWPWVFGTLIYKAFKLERRGKIDLNQSLIYIYIIYTIYLYTFTPKRKLMYWAQNFVNWPWQIVILTEV